MDNSNLTKKPATISNHEKDKLRSKEKKKPDHKTELRDDPVIR
jgi:hypothetical protein